jgi:hypothetical protein
MELKSYIVNDVDCHYVAGKRVRPGQRIQLTERQAMYELDRKIIRLATAADVPSPAPTAEQKS